MGCIHERRSVEVPLALAPEYVGSYIRDVESEGSGCIILSVKIPLERLGFNRCIDITKAVSVHFAHVEELFPAEHIAVISWEPEGGGPYPHFSGTVGVEGDGSNGACYLTLDGSYDPPLGLVGDAIDALVGKHIARQTARNLLDEIAIIMEAAHANV